MLKIMKELVFVAMLSLIFVPKSQTGSFPNVSLKAAKVSNKAIIPTVSLETEQTPVKSEQLLTFRETLKEVDFLIRDMIRSLDAYSPKITNELENLLTNIDTRISHVLEDIGSGLIDAGELLLRETVRNLQNQLFLMKDEFHSLAFLADEQFNLMVDHFNKTLINQTENIDLWATSLKQELRTINNSRFYEKGCQVVDELMRQTTDGLQKCCNITVRPVHSLCKSVREVLAEVFSVIADIIEQMQACLEDKHSYFEYMLPCINVAYDNFNNLIIRSAELRHNITSIMPIKIVFSKFCIYVVSVHMENGQNKVGHSVATNMDL